jgi:hypothetical protein
MKRLNVPIFVACISLILLSGKSAPAADTGGTTAVRATDFLNSLGVCVHVQHRQDAKKLVPQLKYLGVRNVRDGADKNYDLSGLLLLHHEAGVMVDWGPGSGAKDSDLQNTLDAAKKLAAAGALLAVEGPNEPNNFGGVVYQGQKSGVTSGTWMPVAKFQRDLYAAVKSDPLLAKYPVFGPSEMGAETDNVGLQFLTIPAGTKCLMPDGTKYADFANVHNYVCGHIKGQIDNQAFKAATHENVPGIDGLYGNHGKTWRKHFPGYALAELATLPRVTTETGWQTDKTPAGDDIQGKVFLNVFLDQFKAGWRHTFIYELMDDPDGPFGFYKSDYVTARKSATYLHNLTSILADSDGDSPIFVANRAVPKQQVLSAAKIGTVPSGSQPTPGRLDYSIPSQPATVHDMLMQKSTGTFELAVWGEQVKGTNSVTVNLGGTHASVKVYDPTVGTTPVQTLSNVRSVPLVLSDHAMVIEVE